MKKIKIVVHVCFLLLCVGLSNKTYCQIDTSYSLEYMTDTLVLGAHPLTSQFKLKHNSIYISRNSKELAATFDDPSRVLYRHVGISTANDQANGIIYHGLPADFTKWAIHGAEIVNPNHTSNAGTFSDISSQSSGGVLGIPFDVINTFSFHANANLENTPSTVAGVANFNFLSESENFFKIGLLGLELATQSKKTKIPIKTHFRYSTVGLIGQFGVDFGGEKIAFADGFIQAGILPSLNFITGVGFSSNTFEGVEDPEDATIQKELTDIDFKSQFLYSGFVFEKNRHKHTLMYSQKMDKRTATSDFFEVFPEARFDNTKISYAGQIPVFAEDLDNFDVLVNATYNHVDHLFPNSSSNDTRNHFGFALRYKWFNDLYSISAKVGPKLYENTNEMTPEVSLIATRQFNSSSIEWSNSVSSQEQNAEIYGLITNGFNLNEFIQANRSFNSALTYKAEFNKNQKILARLYYHNITRLPININGLSPVLMVPFNDVETELYGVGYAYNYGLELMYDHQFDNGFYLNANLTLFEFKYVSENLWLLYNLPELKESEFNPTNDFNYIGNVNFSKTWKLKKNKMLSANVAFHLRGGAYDHYDITSPEQLKPYRRLDTRVQYEFKKSTISLDIQNVLNRRNDAYYFYDQLLQEKVLQQQLGLIPVLSWKRVF